MSRSNRCQRLNKRAKQGPQEISERQGCELLRHDLAGNATTEPPVSVQMVPPRICTKPLVAVVRLLLGSEANISELPDAWLALHWVHKRRQHSLIQHPAKLLPRIATLFLQRSWRACLPAPQARWVQQCARWLQVYLSVPRNHHRRAWRSAAQRPPRCTMVPRLFATQCRPLT